MIADTTALVLVRPTDDVGAVLERVTQTGSPIVQLLVAEGALAFQTAAGLGRLARSARARGVELVLISSDPAVIAAARQNDLTAMTVRGAQVQAPPPPAGAPPPRDYSTRVLDRPTPPAALDSAADEEFLQALDDLEGPPPARPAAAPEDADIFAALDTLPGPSGRAARPSDDAFAAELDDLDFGPGAAAPPPAPRGRDDAFAAELDDLDFGPGAAAAPPRPTEPRARIRPEDIELTDAERERADRTGRLRTTPAASSRQAPPAGPIVPRGPVVEAPPARRRAGLALALIPLLVVLLLLIGVVLLMGGRVTVAVSAPVPVEGVESFEGLALAVVAPDASSATAIGAQPLSTQVAASVAGAVTEGTLAPSGTASGSLTMLSLNPQGISIPAGTEFVALKADGQEVPFVSTQDVLVPGATTSDQGAQIVTTRGQAQIPVTARSPGSASNVEANAVRRMSLGGQVVNLESGALIVRHDPIGGGSESEVRVVRDSDVQGLLGQALGELDAAARVQLQGLAQQAGDLRLETSTISPRRSDLEQLQGFDLTVSPAVGETVDPNSPGFTVTVQASYSALATPAGAELTAQLQGVLTEQLRQAGRIAPGDCRAPTITDWRWDGATLFVSGQIVPNPDCGGGLGGAELARVADAVRGRSREEAIVALEALRAEGLIGAYELPEVDQLPGWAWQISVVER